MVGVNSVFTGDKFLIMLNNEKSEDFFLFEEFGFEGCLVFVLYVVGVVLSDGSEWKYMKYEL